MTWYLIAPEAARSDVHKRAIRGFCATPTVRRFMLGQRYGDHCHASRKLFRLARFQQLPPAPQRPSRRGGRIRHRCLMADAIAIRRGVSARPGETEALGGAALRASALEHVVTQNEPPPLFTTRGLLIRPIVVSLYSPVRWLSRRRDRAGLAQGLPAWPDMSARVNATSSPRPTCRPGCEDSATASVR